MKKRFFTCVAILALITSVGLTSCSKEDPAKAVDFASYSLSKGTIKGIAYANYNDRPDAPSVQYAPAGTVLFLTVYYTDLGIDNAFNGETRQIPATVEDNKGSFTFSEIPLNRYGTTYVTVNAQSYVDDYTLYDRTVEINGEFVSLYKTEKWVFTASPMQQSVSLQPEGKNFITLDYYPSELFQ